MFANQGRLATLCAQQTIEVEGSRGCTDQRRVGRRHGTPAVTGPTDDAPLGRRARSRRRTLAELRAAALDEVREVGAPALALRSVARRAGMSPAGLYRYVDSRDGLLTWLIADGYDDLADHLDVAIDRVIERDADAPTSVPQVAGSAAGPAARMTAVALAYRAWAIDHPHEFGLIFGDPVPGYAAPPDGPTVVAMGRVGLALATPVLEAFEAHRLRIPPAMAGTGLAEAVRPMETLAPDLPSELYLLLLTLWGRLHGPVSLEVFGHHAWLFPDGCEALYRADVAALIADLGLDTAADPAGL